MGVARIDCISFSGDMDPNENPKVHRSIWGLNLMLLTLPAADPEQGILLWAISDPF